jgi:hypothetical protein
MPRGIGDIADLRLEVLQDFITRFTTPPELKLMNLFGSINALSDSIRWESQEGGRGLAPFVPPGVPSPRTAPYGVTKHSATAATWKEKMYFDEEFLNNLRKPGTDNTYLDAKTRLARELAQLTYRSMRRKEWMFAKMMFNGAITYDVTGGIKASVDYGLPSSHNVTLTTNYMWDATGASATVDILGDIIDAKKTIKDATGAYVEVAMCTSTVLKYLAQDSTIQTLLQKSQFGNGDLFSGSKNKLLGVNTQVIQSLLDIPRLEIYDEQYEVRAYLTGAVTGGSTTVVSVEDVSDFEVGAYVRFVDVSAGTWEDELIASIQTEASTITVTAAPTASFKAGEDFVFMRKTFLPSNKFIMFAPRVEGKSIAEYMNAPYGLNRSYGMQVDRHETWDPDGVFLRVQDKGLPVLYQRDAIYNLTVTSTKPNI